VVHGGALPQSELWLKPDSMVGPAGLELRKGNWRISWIDTNIYTNTPKWASKIGSASFRVVTEGDIRSPES